jgi:hypothetical protein
MGVTRHNQGLWTNSKYQNILYYYTLRLVQSLVDSIGCLVSSKTSGEVLKASLSRGNHRNATLLNKKTFCQENGSKRCRAHYGT